MKKDHSELDFEIGFFEKLLVDKPDYIQALVALGEAYTRRGLYQKGLEIDKRLAGLKPDDPVVFYNLACSYSLINLVDEASDALRKAIALGWSDFKWLERDPDLENLRKNPGYSRMLKELASKMRGQRKIRRNKPQNR